MIFDANMLAKVVFPVPGGPHNINEGKLWFSILDLNGDSDPKIWSCPMKSSKFVGRILSAKGAECLNSASALC